MHGFDRLLARRALAFTTLALAIAIGVTLATDEPYSTFRMRVARLCAIVPALAAIGSAVALAQSRARGELRALEALGVGPFRIGLGPMLVSWVLGLTAAAILVSPLADATSLFPALVSPARWVVDGGSLFDPVSGVRVLRNGSLKFSEASAELGAAFRPGAGVALLALVPLSLVVPLWTSAKLGLFARGAGALVTFAAVVVLMHAAAATRVHPAWLILGPLPLAAQALFAHVRTNTHVRSA
jgi:hypothetical protein